MHNYLQTQETTLYLYRPLLYTVTLFQTRVSALYGIDKKTHLMTLQRERLPKVNWSLHILKRKKKKKQHTHRKT